MNCLVTLAHFQPLEEGKILLWGRCLTGDRATERRPEMDIVMATFAIGHLFIQIIQGGWRSPHSSLVEFPLHDSRLIKCWPWENDDRLDWPPAVGIPAAAFGQIAGPGTQLGCDQWNALRESHGGA